MNLLSATSRVVIAMLNQIGGDPLAGSGFEADQPDPSFTDSDVGEDE